MTTKTRSPADKGTGARTANGPWSNRVTRQAVNTPPLTGPLMAHHNCGTRAHLKRGQQCKRDGVDERQQHATARDVDAAVGSAQAAGVLHHALVTNSLDRASVGTTACWCSVRHRVVHSCSIDSRGSADVTAPLSRDLGQEQRVGRGPSAKEQHQTQQSDARRRCKTRCTSQTHTNTQKHRTTPTHSPSLYA